jgi:hypothetical protein
MDAESKERRLGKDRRAQQKRPALRYLLMGRRGGPRREEDPATGFYAEVYGTKILIASFALLLLSTIDALFTLFHIGRGAKEVNPTMDFLLQMGTDEFFYTKYTITCLGVLFLCMHKNFPYVKQTLIVLILVYMMVITWHLYLLSVY